MVTPLFTLENKHIVWINPRFLPLSGVQSLQILNAGLARKPSLQWTHLYISEFSDIGFKFEGNDKLHEWLTNGGIHEEKREAVDRGPEKREV